MRRQYWLARLQAMTLLKVLGEFLGDEGDGAGAVRGASGRVYRETSADGLMAAMGARWT